MGGEEGFPNAKVGVGEGNKENTYSGAAPVRKDLNRGDGKLMSKNDGATMVQEARPGGPKRSYTSEKTNARGGEGRRRKA